MLRKYIISIFLLLSFINFSYTNASYIDDIKSIFSTTIKKDLSKKITREQYFNFLSDYYLTDLPKSYKYIDLFFKDVKKGTKLYDSLQKMVYLDLIENKSISIGVKKNINAIDFYNLAEKIFSGVILTDSDKIKLAGKSADLSDILVLSNIINNINNQNKIDINTQEDKFRILIDVYETLINNHYNKDKLNKDDIIYSAIQGLAAGTNDKFTTYFPPTEKKQFIDTLAGEYEGIGCYVDMLNPGELRIISPISGSPAEKSGLKANDIILKIDDLDVTKDLSLKDAVSKIKGKAGTKVKLTIKRGTQTLVIEVNREKIVLKDVEGKSLDNETYYMNIRMFGDHLYNDFKLVLNDLKSKTNTKKLIIDLRNNPGGYLEGVSYILSYFVKSGNPVAVVKYNNGLQQSYLSAGYDNEYDFSKLKIIILQNEGSASASEIMIGTLKDYYPNLITIGEKTYGKGSVQTIKNYYDGSSLKYTIAHWFTGKTQTGIDGIGIKPDIEIKYDESQAKNQIDNQLEAAKKL